MKRYLIIICLIIGMFSNKSYGQLIFKIDNFSDKYYGKAYISDTSEVFSNGWIAIYDKKTNKELIKVESEELVLNLHDNEILANIHEAPYGEHSLIMYNDFNFDGINDFAIMDGQYSCYHGPSFNIYLANKNGSFDFSEEFSELSHNYCGMFSSDPESKTISTMSKSGCCWHQYSEYIVSNNIPFAIHIVEETIDGYGNIIIITDKRWDGNKMIETISRQFYEDPENILLSFNLEKNNKKVLLYISNDNELSYAFIDGNGDIEFITYNDWEENSTFYFLNRNNVNSILFTNKDTKYTIYESKYDIGIEIYTNGKIYKNKGKLTSKTGGLENIRNKNLKNIIIESK